MTKLIDLTRIITPGMPVFPGDPGFDVQTVSTYAKDGCLTSRWSFTSHLGTHLDSPLHYVPKGIGLENLSLDTFYGKATKISLVDQTKRTRHPPVKITPAMLEKHEDAFKGSERILVQTGWESKFGDNDYFTSFPSFTIEAVQWIVARKIRLLGFDLPSVSSLRSENEDSANEDAVCHRILLRNKPPVVILEGLMNLDKLPKWPETFTISCFPWPVQGADGCPVRAVAITE